MNKKNWYKLFYVVSVLLIIGFCIRVGTDYFIYPTTGGAMSLFDLFIIRLAVFILPAIISYVLGRICKARYY